VQLVAVAACLLSLMAFFREPSCVALLLFVSCRFRERPIGESPSYFFFPVIFVPVLHLQVF